MSASRFYCCSSSSSESDDDDSSSDLSRGERSMIEIKENRVREWTWIDLNGWINFNRPQYRWQWMQGILDMPRGHSDAGYTASNGVSGISRGERSTSSNCSRLSQAPGSGTRKQSDASSRDKKRRLQPQQRMNPETKAVYSKL